MIRIRSKWVNTTMLPNVAWTKKEFLAFVNNINDIEDPKYNQLLTLHETLEVDDSLDTLKWSIQIIYDSNRND